MRANGQMNNASLRELKTTYYYTAYFTAKKITRAERYNETTFRPYTFVV